ncbi:putative duf1168 domain protein [Rosellinia necatrix]|uniref:Putative duf1168 domain protein n=1 Tax=Rosellinia necatrix TaxID=77044 RepID=A0A1W2TR97_ROSNE|nr:putative duf1168 domain protein [Rosellinia necatrix]
MSGEGPESVPTSADPRSKRPTKRRALTPQSGQARELDALFARPEQEVRTDRPSGGAAGAGSRPLPAPPEIVTNVQGSSAGAGSGEFHVYKASRRREYERLRRMDDELARGLADAEFERSRDERLRRDDEKTRRNRDKRDKKRRARERAKIDGSGGGGGGGGAATADAAAVVGSRDNPPTAVGGGTAGATAQNGVKPRIEPRTNKKDYADVVQDAADQPMEEATGIVIEDD